MRPPWGSTRRDVGASSLFSRGIRAIPKSNMDTKQPKRRRAKAESGRGEPVPSRGRTEVYPDAVKLEAMHLISELGSRRAAATKLGIGVQTVVEWSRQPRWATELRRITEENLRAIDEVRDAERLSFLRVLQDARELFTKMVAQEMSGDLPRDQRVRSAVALGAVREAANAAAVFDRMAKTVAESVSDPGGIVVQVVRGGSVKREPVAAES
jgi:hypothetical protein